MARPKKEKLTVDIIKDAVKKAKESLNNHIEYNGSLIVVEPSGRVVIAIRGLFVAEFIAIEGEEVEQTIERAKEYIDGSAV